MVNSSAGTKNQDLPALFIFAALIKLSHNSYAT